MSVFTEGLVDDPLTQDALEPTASERRRAAVAETWSTLVGPSLVRWAELDEARRWGGGAYPEEYGPDEARKFFEDNGVGGMLTPEDRTYNRLELSILTQRKQAEIRRQYTLQRAKGGFAEGGERLLLALGTSLGDPLTVASAFVPVVSQSRYARLVAGARGAMGRAGVRAAVGAAEGGVGAALVEPLVYSAKQAEQADYDAYDSLANVAFGTIFGGGLHVVGGAVGDYRQARQFKSYEEASKALQDRINLLASIEPRAPDAAAPVDESITVYHGSPWAFDEFRMSRIGTGEGAQAYGHGIYLAESRGVAQSYATPFNGSNPKIPDDVLAALRSVDNLGFDTPSQALSAIRKNANDWRTTWDAAQPEHAEAGRTIDRYVAENPVATRGTSIYEVSLPKSALGKMLDWDKPIGEQPHVMEAFGIVGRDMAAEESVIAKAHAMGVAPTTLPEYKALESSMDSSRASRDMTGAEFYRDLTMQKRDWAIAAGKNEHTTLDAAQRLASEELAAFGIPGIKYLDAGSRGAGDGTRNYVIFDAGDAKIQTRNGEPVASDRAAKANPQTRESALRTLIAQDLSGEPRNVEPVFELDPATRTKPAAQALDGFEPAARTPAETPSIVEATDEAALNEQLSDLQDNLKALEAERTLDGAELPADLRVEIEAADEAVTQSKSFAEAARLAVACAMRSIL